jgi:NAD(P)-dependent dehydrogenase (short-subunit alcohol dehydrogenase family)
VTRNLALDLSPIRVNAVEPGAVNTGLWDGPHFKSVEEREASLNKMYKHFPVGKAAAVEEVAEAYMYLLRDSNATGEVLKTRGGQHLI